MFPVDTIAGVKAIQKLASNSLIFFHEATFPNKNRRWAKMSLHSTPFTAVGDGLKSNSNHLILTHIADMRYGMTSKGIEATEEAILKQAGERLTSESIPFQIKKSTKTILEMKNQERTILVVRDLDTFIYNQERLFLKRHSISHGTQYIQYLMA